MKILAKVIFLLWHLVFGLAIETYYMSNYCNSKIDMIVQDIFTGRLSIDGTFAGDCNVTIETRYSANRLMFYFENIYLPEDSSKFCKDNYLQVYDTNGLGDYQLMHGLHKICGSHTPSQVYVPKGRYVMFRYVSNGTATNKMDLVFTAFHTDGRFHPEDNRTPYWIPLLAQHHRKIEAHSCSLPEEEHQGRCRSTEYKCSNGRCIDDSVNCDGLNPCGDYSDCHLSTAAIAGIVFGSVFVVSVGFALIFVWFKNKRQQPIVRTVRSGTSPSSLLINPAANYGASGNGYSNISDYSQVVTQNKFSTNSG